VVEVEGGGVTIDIVDMLESSASNRDSEMLAYRLTRAGAKW